VTVGCEATGPYWLSRYAALTAQGYQVLVLTPLYVKARRGMTLRGTKTDPLDARLMAEILPREQVPASHVPAAVRWHCVVDHLNLHPSESWQRCVGSASGLELDLGAKGQRGILQSMATRAAFLWNIESMSERGATILAE